MKDRPMSRRDAIGEAIIEVLALEGPRGLTHRRIDEALGYPLGSTSSYFRRRTDLFRAGYEKLSELNSRDMVGGLRAAIPEYDEGGPLELLPVATHHMQVWKLLTQDHPHRLVANLEYLLEGARDRELRRMIEHNISREEAFAVDLFSRLGAQHPGLAAVYYSNFLHAESWLFLLVPPHSSYRERSVDFFREKLLEIISVTDREERDMPLSRFPEVPRVLTWLRSRRAEP